jgi:hypothetical protein
MTPKCSVEDCGSPAIGFRLGTEEDEPLCSRDYDKAQLAGEFTYLLDEQICEACKGRSFYGLKICQTCSSTGVVSVAAEDEPSDGDGWHDCDRCKGLGKRRRRRGRPYGWTRDSGRIRRSATALAA